MTGVRGRGTCPITQVRRWLRRVVSTQSSALLRPIRPTYWPRINRRVARPSLHPAVRHPSVMPSRRTSRRSGAESPGDSPVAAWTEPRLTHSIAPSASCWMKDCVRRGIRGRSERKRTAGGARPAGSDETSSPPVSRSCIGIEAGVCRGSDGAAKTAPDGDRLPDLWGTWDAINARGQRRRRAVRRPGRRGRPGPRRGRRPARGRVVR